MWCVGEGAVAVNGTRERRDILFLWELYELYMCNTNVIT